MNRGILLALGAYIFWGLHPIYWKLLKHVPSFEIVSHRVFWSFVFFILILTVRKDWITFKKKLKENFKNPIFYIPALLIGSNWAVYIWAVNAN
ncbi:MAG: EamA family transporter, partial [Candidatus Aminicenantes bacterium]|nr:EamA family transporter [Candidatus Aminicenantes bacterium]